MTIIIYPDYETDLTKYEKLKDILVYDENGTINSKFQKTNSLNEFSKAEAIIFTQKCIIKGEYDTSRLKQACENIQNCVLDEVLLIFDTQAPPRTVLKMSKIIDEYELIPDIKLAYTTIINNNLRIIAGKNVECQQKAVKIYEDMGEEIRTVQHIQTAEFIPILQNSYKDTLVALSNQMAIISEAITIDLIEAIDLANTSDEINIAYPKPILENNILRDANEVNNIANEYGEPSQLSETARNTNNYVAYHMAYMAEKELYLKEHLAMFETTVAILGVTEDDKLISQKDNASLMLIDDFVSRDVEVWVHDDKVEQEIIEDHGAKKISIEEVYDADCIIVMIDTEEYRQLNPEKIEKVIITALPLYDSEKYENVKYSSVGQYRLKEGEML